MNNGNYSGICNHARLTRLDNNFVRCLGCGQSFVSQKSVPANKTRRDFTRENKSFTRNFDRNFSNILEEVDTVSDAPLYEYYIDRNWTNGIIINRAVKFSSDPPKYEVDINGQTAYLDNSQIMKLLSG